MKALAENGKTLSCRQRQWKKDESIRKKIEQELSKKRQSRISTTGVIFHPDKKINGTVSTLGLSPALAVGMKSLVLEAAQWMMVKKHNCVIVMDNQGNPCGTVTAKDITYQLVACRLSARSATVADIMERNPVCVASTTPAHVAIDLMVARGARHAIVHSKNGKVSGLLDITKCLHIFIRRMEKGYELEKAEQECVQFAPYPHSHTRLLRDNMVHPTLLAMSKHHSHKSKFVRVSIRDQVHNVIDIMKVNWATAALVYDDCRLVGIFTPKDVVLRVVAAGITLYNCSMVRIMTPQPDVAIFSTSILEAFKMMNDGCFKNMPLMDKNGDIVDLVDIMELIQLLEVQ
ncbi:CBS-domain-containing protein [Lichtheimia hyalospora FSU 10163]|nr:CBS-domain-containing protein [Lichtheimia hyalospora FSU 10163]